MRLTRPGFSASAMVLVLATSPAVAGDLSLWGDGSGTNNNDLLRAPGDPCEHCVPNIPLEGDDPLVGFDWSLGLRAGMRDAGTGDGPGYVAIALPSITYTRETLRGGYDFGLAGEISHAFDGSDPRIGAISATAGGAYAVDELTVLDGRVNLSVSQDDPGGSDYASNVASAPLEVTGDVLFGASRDFGAFDVSARATAGRSVLGDTEYEDGTSSSNEYQNTTWFGGGARLGYKLTPGITAFFDAETDAEQYDTVSPSLLVDLDNVTYAGRAGLTAKVDEMLELEGSIGLGYRDFEDAGIEDFAATLYDARVTYRPDETLTITGAFTTTVSSPGQTSGAAAKREYAASVDVAYQATPWLRLRADAGWSEAHYQGIDNDKYVWGGGFGADYLLNENTDLTADYSFERSETTPNPATDAHQVTLGVLLHR